MIRTTTIGIGLAALAAAAPAAAHSSADVSLSYSARAQATLAPMARVAADQDAHAQARVSHALAVAGKLETKAAAGSRRTLSHGRSTTPTAVHGAGRVIVRLDATGRAQLAILRASSDDRVRRQAAAGVKLTAKLTSALDAKVAGVTVKGNASAQIAAAGEVTDSSPRVVASVRGLVTQLASEGNVAVDGNLRQAIALTVSAHGRVVATLERAQERGHAAGHSATLAALDSAREAGVQIRNAIEASGQADQPTGGDVDASGQASGQVTLGDLAGASVTGNAAGGARIKSSR